MGRSDYPSAGAFAPAGPASVWSATSPIPACQLALAALRARSCGLCLALGCDCARGPVLSPSTAIVSLISVGAP
eukprot:6467037-Alexandrium_andersonii.AAC.1